MFFFKAEQKKYEIGGVKIGGQPGEVPTVLVGSIFYSRHRIVSDERAGIFDKDAADTLIKKQAELSDKTGNPALLDIVGSTPEAIKKYVDFVAGASEKPFLIDSPGVDVKIAAVEYAKEAGLSDRIIYNSVSIETKDAEFAALEKNGTSAVILLAYTRKITSSADRIAVVEKFAPRLTEAWRQKDPGRYLCHGCPQPRALRESSDRDKKPVRVSLRVCGPQRDLDLVGREKPARERGREIGRCRRKHHAGHPRLGFPALRPCRGQRIRVPGSLYHRHLVPLRVPDEGIYRIVTGERRLA